MDVRSWRPPGRPATVARTLHLALHSLTGRTSLHRGPHSCNQAAGKQYQSDAEGLHTRASHAGRPLSSGRVKQNAALGRRECRVGCNEAGRLRHHPSTDALGLTRPRLSHVLADAVGCPACPECFREMKAALIFLLALSLLAVKPAMTVQSTESEPGWLITASVGDWRCRRQQTYLCCSLCRWRAYSLPVRGQRCVSD